ncbi:hypothetical protein WN944_001307 [Citrus x changshan-huyou]|uniref:Uncharacterized protein n=1 Tax=Citrus x changshan-huyou TaxID=2935761 RepID=A0AAP0QR29_9ROSI
MASKVGFVGLDEYSVDMAASLIRSGYKVQAFEISDPLVDKFLMLGGIRSASPMDAGKVLNPFLWVHSYQIGLIPDEDVSALVVVISHVDQIDDIFFGHEGVLKENDETACVVDAYVSRGMSEVFNGKFMITTSGRSNAIERARPFLSAMCKKLYIFEGELGAGSKIKMVNDLLEGVHLIASVEAISLGVQFGIHPWVLYDIISNAAGNSWIFKNHIPNLLRGNAKLHFLNAFIQNLGIALDMAKTLAFPLLLLAVAHQQLIVGLSHAHANDDNPPLVKVWENVLGVNITDAANLEAYKPEELAKQITAKSNSVTRVGFIGLGAMGFGMATHLLRSNFTVVGYDVYRPTLTEFQNVGGLIANSPAEAAKDVGVLVIMVTNEAQAESVLYGDLGAVPALSSRASIILSSTVSPGFVSQLERRLQFLTPKVTFSKRVLSYIEHQSFIGYS